MVSVTPEDSSKAVLMVGSQNGVITWNGSMMPAGDAVAPGETDGHTALKTHARDPRTNRRRRAEVFECDPVQNGIGVSEIRPCTAIHGRVDNQSVTMGE